MKKSILIIGLIVLFTGVQFSERLLWTSLSANIFSHNDKNYKEIYGDYNFSPEIKISFEVFSSIFVWSDFLLVKGYWESDEYDINATSNQMFFSLGLGDQMDFTEKIRGSFEVGFMYILYDEVVAGEKISGSDFGFTIGAGLNYRLGRNVFILGGIGYLKGASSIGNKEIKLGGLKASIGIELTLINKKIE